MSLSEAELMHLASLNTEPQTLGEITAHAWKKNRDREIERERRRHEEAERYKRHLDNLNKPPAARPSGQKKEQPASEAYAYAVAEAIGVEGWKFAKKYIDDSRAKHLAELAVVKGRLAELEQRPPSMRYEGVWSETKAYDRGSFVTFHGSLWHCEDTNIGVHPGDGSTSWKLAVKRGRDAKDR